MNWWEGNVVMKKFIITIDTEFDNGWEWQYGDPITTANAAYIPRFQELCESYGFIPTYLITYEFAQDRQFVDYMKPKQFAGKCEIGIHPHAWNIPPIYNLTIRKDIAPGYVFLKEYPDEIIFQKIKTLKEEYIRRFECEPVSHRAARWGMNRAYFEQLDKNGILYDCSVTPLIDWTSARGYTENSCGPDYTDHPRKVYRVKGTGIIEIPMSVYMDHRFILNEGGNTSKKRNIKNFVRAVKGKKTLWLRPAGDNLTDLLYIVDQARKHHVDYLMFILHSSEMMPGGNPVFNTPERIEMLYENLEILFREISRDFEGISVADYGRMMEQKNLYMYSK